MKDPLNQPQWRLFLKENYQEDKSLFIFKIHHVLTDGYGLAVLVSKMLDNIHPEEILPHLPKFTLFQKVIMYLSVPYHAIMMQVKFLFYVKDDNPLTNLCNENSGVK